MQCCGTTKSGTPCSRITNARFCHQHDEKNDSQTCAVVDDATVDKLKSLGKNLTDLEINSVQNCNCSLVAKISEFRNLQFLTIKLQNYCDKPDYGVWGNFVNLLYLDLNITFKNKENLFQILQRLPNLQHLVLWDLETLTVPNPKIKLDLHTLVLKGSIAEPHKLDLSVFSNIKRFNATRSDFGLGKVLKAGFKFGHLIVLEIGGLIFEELNTEADLQYLPKTIRYLKIKHILYPNLLKQYLLSLENLEYLDLQDSFSLNKIADIIPELTNLQGIYVNTINFADLAPLTIKSLESAKFRNNWLSLDYSYSDLLKYDQHEHKNIADEISNQTWFHLKELFHLSDMTVNDKGWEIPNDRNNTPQQWLEENEFIVKEVCKCKL